MIESHYGALVGGYAVAVVGWFLMDRLARDVWPVAAAAEFDRPWRAVGAALVAVVAVVGIGQLYVHGIRLPERGPFGPVAGALNQAAIFAPIPVLLLWRREPWSTAWLARGRLPTRLGAGALLALLALGTYTLLRRDADPVYRVAGRILRYDNLDKAVQVFMEDLTIAVLFVRLAAAVGTRQAVALVALLFAAGHIPAMVSGGATWLELAGLLRDVALGVAVVGVLQRSRDIVWFWCVHFVMDMSQFPAIVFGP